ncbi:MAG: hypothetical protein H6R14_522 [Proteobacteria bacterium]|nr:hypothetical protein [Pseudomonadota bacterium]
MRLLLACLATALMLPTSPVLAKGSGDTTGFSDDIDGRCQVWAPSMLGQRDYALRYRGGCKNGRADGKGKAEWLYRYAEMKVKATWEGDFRNGVFLDGQKVRGSVEPVSGDKYIVAMGNVPGAELFFIARSPQDGPMELCKVDQIALVLGPRVDVTDDDPVQRVMEAGVKAYQDVCDKGTRYPNVGIFTEAIKLRPNGMLPNPVANARYDSDTGRLGGYSNDAANKARQAKQQAEFAQKQDDVRKQFNAFSSKHGIAAWVTAQQLEENPFRWEGKTVGLVVRLDRMVARDTALVRGALRDWSPSLQLRGITPDFPESRRSVLLAAKVGKRERLPDDKDQNGATFVTLNHIDSSVCERGGCSDWFIWARGDRELVWGEPFTAR